VTSEKEQQEFFVAECPVEYKVHPSWVCLEEPPGLYPVALANGTGA